MEPKELSEVTPLDRILDRVSLCTLVIQEAHEELELPETADGKADLLIAVEALTYEALDLLQTTKRYVWGEEPTEEEDE
jgi:hypothetical protein